MMAILPLIMDVLVIGLLGVTLFFAVRLSAQLKIFRQTRSDLRQLITDLSGQITQAEMAITGLREAARQSGRDLQELISQGSALKDEMEMIHDSSDRLATRLENSPARKGMQQPQQQKSKQQHKVSFNIDDDFDDAPNEKTAPRSAASGGGMFSIRDPEFDQADNDDDADLNTSDNYDAELEDFQSRAEKELFEALRGKKKVEFAGDA